ncbi:hypothetical protein VTK73DRAFT_5129 [Phialemonium thermophilum]|uniref:Uncharacterized protein n=1 Tax=Phialemonium thermophilum TaxID=223376 RepID=A0ABR3V3D5_9PEZI
MAAGPWVDARASAFQRRWWVFYCSTGRSTQTRRRQCRDVYPIDGSGPNPSWDCLLIQELDSALEPDSLPVSLRVADGLWAEEGLDGRSIRSSQHLGLVIRRGTKKSINPIYFEPKISCSRKLLPAPLLKVGALESYVQRQPPPKGHISERTSRHLDGHVSVVLPEEEQNAPMYQRERCGKASRPRWSGEPGRRSQEAVAYAFRTVNQKAMICPLPGIRRFVPLRTSYSCPMRSRRAIPSTRRNSNHLISHPLVTGGIENLAKKRKMEGQSGTAR